MNASYPYVHPYAQVRISCMYIWAQQHFLLIISQNQHALLKHRSIKVKNTELQNFIAKSKVWEQLWRSASEASETLGTLDKKRRQAASLKASCSIQSYLATATISYHLVRGQKKQGNNSVKQKIPEASQDMGRSVGRHFPTASRHFSTRCRGEEVPRAAWDHTEKGQGQHW